MMLATGERAAHVHIRAASMTLHIPTWTRTIAGRRRHRLRRNVPFALLELLPELRFHICRQLSVAAALCLRQTCKALRTHMRRLLHDQTWRSRALRLSLQWTIQGPPQLELHEAPPSELITAPRGFGRYDIEDNASVGRAVLAWPCHAVLADAQQLLVAQGYTSEFGGSDNVRLHYLSAEGSLQASVRFDYWLGRLPQQRCVKATDPLKLALSGGRVFILNRQGSTLEVQVRELASGELVWRFPVGNEDTSEVDMALGSSEASVAGEDGEVEIYVLERLWDEYSGEEACAVSSYGVDGATLRPRWRTALPEAWQMFRYPAREDSAGSRVHDIAPSGIASHGGLIYLASCGSLVSVHTPDGRALRAWRLSGVRASPNDSIAVDEAAVYVARPRARHTDVHACSHHGQPLASFCFVNVARLDTRSGLMMERFRSKVSVTSGCVCVTDEIDGRQGYPRRHPDSSDEFPIEVGSGSMQHVVHCIRFAS